MNQLHDEIRNLLDDEDIHAPSDIPGDARGDVLRGLGDYDPERRAEILAESLSDEAALDALWRLVTRGEGHVATTLRRAAWNEVKRTVQDAIDDVRTDLAAERHEYFRSEAERIRYARDMLRAQEAGVD